MPYVVVDNFSGGLDSRRHVLNSKSGTLSFLKNAHITRGGEIEKRKAFVQALDLATLGVTTFGLEATNDGIYVFGGDALPGTMPSGYVYQRLQYPPDIDDPTSNNFRLVNVVYSTVYGGKPFVIAEFGKYPALTPTHRMAYYDGVPIKDWYEGYSVIDENLPSAAQKLANMISLSGSYTATTSSTTNVDLFITGPIGKSFTATAVMGDPDITTAITNTQTHKAAVPETISKGSFKITAGSTTSAYVFRNTRFLDAASLPGIRSIRVGASSTASNDGFDLIGWASPTGLKYNTVTPTETTGSNGGSLYWNIRKAINDNTTAGLAHDYSSRWRWGGNSSGNDLNDLWIDAPPSQGSDANGMLVQVEFDSNPTGVANLSEFINTSTIAVSPYNASKYIATIGVFANGSYNRINSVKVDGIEVLDVPVSWGISHGVTASAVADQINAFNSAPEYTASVVDGSRVVITVAAGFGKTPNGRTVSVEAEGNIGISEVSNFSGGVDVVAAVSQITRVRYTTPGSLNISPGYKYSITIVDPDNPTVPLIFGASRVAGVSANFATTYKSKVYLGAESTLYFSAVNDATKWDIYDTGSGFIDMSNNFGGRESLTGAGTYQGKLAVFSRRNVQLWGMDADPAQNQQVQILANTGAIATDSIVSVGAIDLIYLADNGIRSLRARENTDTAYTNDIGSPIDGIIINDMAAIDIDAAAAAAGVSKYTARAVIEPVDGRYWLSIGGKIYVLSYFMGSNIMAWSVYEPTISGSTPQWGYIKEMVSKDDKVYLRASNNKIYVYGGNAGTTYDNCEVVVELPYLDGNKPATYKEAKGIDMTCAGEWRVSIGFDHTNPTARDLIATITQSTFALGKIPATGQGTHFGPRFVNQAAGPALLANFIVHFDEMHSKHDAG
jgi:hypothetical protein